MAKSLDKFQIVYRGETLEFYKPDEWVFFQRPVKNGGGYWLGKTYDFVFMLAIPYPVSIAQGMDFMRQVEGLNSTVCESVDDFRLE